MRVRQPDSFMVSHPFSFFPQVAIDPMPALAPLVGHARTHGAEWLSPDVWSLGLALGVPTRPC